MKNLLELFNKFISDEALEQLTNAVLNGEDFTLQKDGLKVKIRNVDSAIEASISYENPTEDLVKEFKEFCDSLNDEIFVGICEKIGKEGIERIQTCLDSSNIESVRSAIRYFKSNAKDYLNVRIEELKKQLSKI